MTSRAGLETQASLHSGGSGPAHRRRPSKPVNVIDPALEHHNGLSDQTRLPPKGRPELFYHTVAGNGMELPIHSFPYQPSTNLPVPPRPGSNHLADPAQQRRIVPGGSGVKDAPKLTATEAVSAPVQFASGRVADVFPWTGNNTEDTLTEALIKAGISNKPQIMNETNTARQTLIPNLKNKSGLNSLTSLFVAVLDKRQQSGRLAVPNTFKPPPRLTLRDSTRESWLHDLANPTPNMRRLSRTIPHGLTGKVLLEQCLNKNIPLSKAVWLAKCVGINELRAHKRKGHAGTVTWGRGWTSSVEQFLEAVISSIGQGDWKSRMTYSLQLATYFYKEHLLDIDHFLDWMMGGLDGCPSERLFIWILVVSIPHYWKDITSCRRRGKRLAESLLNHLGKLYNLEIQEPFAALITHVENTILKVLALRPACLLLPSTWAKHGPILQTLATKRDHPQITHWVKSLDRRNNRLAQSSTTSPFIVQTSAARIVGKLDSVDYTVPVRIDDLSYECMEILANATHLTASLLQWACSYYREGTHRTYLAIRLLRRWSHLGADIYEGITSFSRDTSWLDSGEPRVLCRIVAELVRSKHFSAGRYFQWLIATGSLGQMKDLSSRQGWPVRLITAIPISGLSDQVRNLRCTLLRGTPYSAEAEGQALEVAKRSVAQAIPALFGQVRTGIDPKSIALQNLSPTLKLELGIWLRQRVAQHAEVNDHVPTKEPGIEETAAVSLISSYDYHIVRSWLEQFGDLAILADVVGIAASSLDFSVLAATAETLNYHFKAFRSIGALDPLFGRIETRYTALKTIRYPDREFILSLQRLTRTVRPDAQAMRLFAFDLSRIDSKNSVAACSPASDNMGEVMHQIGACSDDEIERILSSGTSMDQQMMARVYKKIIINMQDHITKGQAQFDNYPSWFWRLRNFDEAAFDSVIHEWLLSCLMSHQVQLIQLAMPFLVSVGCVALSDLLDELLSFINKFRGSHLHEASSTAVAGLRMLLNMHGLAQNCSPQDAYRHRLEQDRLAYEPGARILHGIGEVIDLVASTPAPKVQESLMAILSSQPVLAILRHHIATDPKTLVKMKVGKPEQWPNERFLKPILLFLLDPTRKLNFGKKSLEEQIVTTFEVADDLSLPICQAVIDYIFTKEASSGSDASDVLSGALSQAVKAAVDEDRSAGLQLLVTLEKSLTNKIRQYAEQEILDASAFLVNLTGAKHEDTGKASTIAVQKYLKVVRLTSNTPPEPNDPTAMLNALVERFRGISLVLNDGSLTEMPAAFPMNTLLVKDIEPWLHALLHLSITHCPKILANATVAQQASILGSMKSLLLHPAFEMYPSMTEQIFDATVYLSDFVSDDARINTARNDNVRSTDDARCQYILGVAPTVDGWLAVAKPVNNIHNPQTSSQPSTPITSQVQASPFQSPSISSSGPATPQQRYFNQQQQQRQQMQQAQQMRSLSQSSQQYSGAGRNLPAQLQRAASSQTSALQQMQQMQQMQGFSQQRATQPSPVHSQRATPAAGKATLGGPVGGPNLGKLNTNQLREYKQYPFMQPRWELLADTSANPNLNETSISLTLFGARKV